MGAGHCVARSADLAPLHPEKVFLIREAAWATSREELQTAASVILSACAYCANSANAKTIAELLAQPRYIGVSRAALLASLLDVTDQPITASRRTLFYGTDVNDPTADKAGTLLNPLRTTGLITRSLPPLALGSLFRTDLFHAIRQSNRDLSKLACIQS
jgi:NitT/TauT family transport system ATP-binding protein/nitrate/nitrite transport system substrate-binding protein